MIKQKIKKKFIKSRKKKLNKTNKYNKNTQKYVVKYTAIFLQKIIT